MTKVGVHAGCAQTLVRGSPSCQVCKHGFPIKLGDPPRGPGGGSPSCQVCKHGFPIKPPPLQHSSSVEARIPHQTSATAYETDLITRTRGTHALLAHIMRARDS